MASFLSGIDQLDARNVKQTHKQKYKRSDFRRNFLIIFLQDRCYQEYYYRGKNNGKTII